MLTPKDHLQRFMKTRSTLSGEDSVFWWKGNIYSFIPGERSQKLFQFEGYNISRVQEVEGGYILITREASFYKDAETGAILENWHNPLNGRDVEVVHVWNDPVNQKMMEQSERGAFAVPTEDLHNGFTCLYFDVMLAYPSPLPRDEYPLYSQADLYQGGELFQFFVKTDDLEDDSRESIPCTNSWTRVASWVPFMEMADHPGNMVYQCRGAKLEGGFSALPQDIQDYVMANQPKYSTAPSDYVTPNETSWSYFKKLLAERGYTAPEKA